MGVFAPFLIFPLQIIVICGLSVCQREEFEFVYFSYGRIRMSFTVNMLHHKAKKKLIKYKKKTDSKSSEQSLSPLYRSENLVKMFILSIPRSF